MSRPSPVFRTDEAGGGGRGDVVERVRLRDGAVLWTASRPRPGAPAVVMLHGGPGMWDYLAPVADLLDEVSTYRYDQRGCGRSSLDGDYRVERYVADLEELRRHHGCEQWAVFGHSAGAGLALAYAAAHPDRVDSLVHCSGVGLDWPAHRATARARARARLSAQQALRWAELDEVGAQARTWDQEVQWRTLQWLPDFAAGSSAEQWAHAAARTELPLNMECNHVLGRQLSARGLTAELAECAAVTAPVLVVHGSADPRPVEPVAALAEALPNSWFAVVDGGGHHPWVERPPEFATLVGDFLRPPGRGGRSADGTT